MTQALDTPSAPSEKSRGVALALAAVLGVFGAHRFYVGKTGTGLAMLCTLGGAGLWYLHDLIVVAGGSFRDAKGRLVSLWDPEEATHFPGEIPQEILDELSALRSEVSELGRASGFYRATAGPAPADGRPQLPVPQALTTMAATLAGQSLPRRRQGRQWWVGW